MKNARYKNGFSIVELLIALAITAILMVAVAVAFSASMMSYRQNEDIFKAVNSARQALYRITTELRTATAVDPNGPANECSFITAGGQDITYEYRDTDSKLYLITNSDSQEYVLCDNVSAMTFTRETRTVEAVTFVASVQVSMTVEIGDAERNVSAAAVIRRNLN
ncbi:MAG: PulJ/GspJ family protein [Planctomycetota bacterium]|jgi:prepilin-type N-terminal cleavage/methylation domain-containing protein